MIKFFRHIRKSLLMENKTGKPALQAGRYFKYAIGEILLVVIGILIALSINNWNENRINSNKETVILANIHKEFTKNKIQLDTMVSKLKKTHSNCTKIMSLFPIKSKPVTEVLDSLSGYLWGSYGGLTFNPSQSSINALTSTSSFNIINDEKLRALLISWNDLIIDYQEEEQASREYMWNQYDPYLSIHFDFNFDFKDSRNNSEALQTLKFEYMVKRRHELIGIILTSSGELQKVQETIDKIIELSKSKNN